MTDILNSAKAHDWYAYDKTLAEELIHEIKCLRDEVALWKRAADEGHPQPCTLGPQCPYCEIERLRTALSNIITGSRDPITIAVEALGNAHHD
jgi:hypothetical protein